MGIASEKSALVLLHGVLMSGRAWQSVVPLLSDRHRVYSMITAGHRGGSSAPRLPATVNDLVDDAEDCLDKYGLNQPHIAGLSLGGWMALELARRGRATTVCALAPAGFWTPGDDSQKQARDQIRKLVAMGRLVRCARPVVALAVKSATVRRVGFRDVACHGDRFTPAQSMDALDDIVGCTVETDDFLGSNEQIAPLDPPPCPVTIAWSENDAIIQVLACDEIAHERIPQASFTTLPGVGHDPMIDDPSLVARTILTATSVR